MKKGLKLLWLTICLGVILFTGMKIYGIYSEYEVGTQTYENLAEQYVSLPDTKAKQEAEHDAETPDGEKGHVTVLPEVDFASLKKTCKDVVAWIYCEGTPINYPIVQGGDNDYYLYRLLDGRSNKNGTLFMDCRNHGDFSDMNTIIYGHNMKNGSMFGILPDYMDQEFYEEHPVWYLLTEEKSYRIELVGGYVTPAESETYGFPTDAAGREALFQKAARSSSFKSGVQLEENDRLITMSTCVYDYDDARYVLVGVLRE